METINNGMCRCCSSEGTFKDVSTRYQWMGEEEIYADMLRECFDITLTPSDDGQEAGICEVCITQLRNSANFKRQVQQTEEQFKRRLQDLPFKSNIVKVEASPLEDPVHGVSDDDSKFSDEICFAGDFQEVPIKTESSDEVKSKKRSAKATTSRAKQPKLEAETSTKRKRLATVKRIIGSELALKVNYRPEIPKDQLRPIPELHKHRTNVTLILQHSNATPLHRVAIGYGCCYCSEQFKDPANLKIHTLENHDNKAVFMEGTVMFTFFVKLDITFLQCSECGEFINSLEELVEHLIKVHKIMLHTDIKNRILPFKFEDDTLRCVVCTRVFNKFKVLVEHMSSHYRNYVCDVCGVSYVTPKMLNNHLKYHELGVFPCNTCDKNFDTLMQKKNHEKYVHRHLNRRHKCDFCDKKFQSGITKENHMAKTHGVPAPPREVKHPIVQRRETKHHVVQHRDVMCLACEKTFATSTLLMTHTKRVHLMERRYDCEYCDMKFFTRQDLKNHSVKHTGIREFQCGVCQKWYSRKHTLEEHMRIHLNDKRFSCEICGKAFVQNRGIKKHMQVKHGKLARENCQENESD